MKVYVEVVILIIIALIFLIWFAWFHLSRKYHNWRYKPENDRGKKSEEHRQELLRRESSDRKRSVEKATSGSRGQGEPEGRGDVPTTGTSDAGKDSDSIGSTSKSGRKPKNPFKKQ